MRFLTKPDCYSFASESPVLNNRALMPANFERVEGGPSDTERLGYFSEELIRWLPSHSGRLLFLNELTMQTGHVGAVRAIRVGLGGNPDIEEAPGHYFGPHSWTWDQLEMSQEQRADGEVLVGMLILTMSGKWDGWLVAENCSDMIEFWEGNVLFYSSTGERLEKARAILKSLECRTHLI